MVHPKTPKVEGKSGAVVDSHSGGDWSEELKLAGFDAIILRGKAERPVYLWLHDGKAQIKEAKEDKRLKGRKILVIDDEPMIRQTIGDLLRRFGCSVDGVAEGNKAVEKINKHNYDLILSDIKMPGKNGYEIFAAAKDKNPDLPVILMTGFGYDPHHSIVRARKEGLAAVLFKPFKVDQLLGEIRKAIQV